MDNITKKIVVNLEYKIIDGSEVVFRSPMDCSDVTCLKVYYRDEVDVSKEFVLADAHGNDIGGKNLFAAGAVVKVILDVTNNKAFVQNADTNAYLEEQLETLRDLIDSAVTAALPNAEEVAF